MESRSSSANLHVIALGSRRGFLMAGLSGVIFANAQHFAFGRGDCQFTATVRLDPILEIIEPILRPPIPAWSAAPCDQHLPAHGSCEGARMNIGRHRLVGIARNHRGRHTNLAIALHLFDDRAFSKSRNRSRWRENRTVASQEQRCGVFHKAPAWSAASMRCVPRARLETGQTAA